MLLQLLASTFRVSTPLLFAALGGLFSERAGVINIALEGLMLIGAFGAAVGTLATHSPWLGSILGAAAGVALAAVYGLFVIRLRANQIIAGMAINMLAFGLTPFLCKILYDVTGSTPAIPVTERFRSAPLYLNWAIVAACYLWLKYTAAGLRLTFAGEHPVAFLSSSFSRNMTGGRGFMALAALVFGKWKPVPTALACLLFGFSEAVQIRLQGVSLWGHQPIPVQFIQILPYVVTMLVLAGFVGRSRPPKALGLPFRKP